MGIEAPPCHHCQHPGCAWSPRCGGPPRPALFRCAAGWWSPCQPAAWAPPHPSAPAAVPPARRANSCLRTFNTHCQFASKCHASLGNHMKTSCGPQIMSCFPPAFSICQLASQAFGLHCILQHRRLCHLHAEQPSTFLFLDCQSVVWPELSCWRAS